MAGVDTSLEKDGAARTIKSLLRLIMPHELLSWLREAGLEPRALFGDLEGKPHGLESPRLVAIARKS